MAIERTHKDPQFDLCLEGEKPLPVIDKADADIKTELTEKTDEYDPITMSVNLYNGEQITMNSGDHEHYFNNDTNHPARRARVNIHDIAFAIDKMRKEIDFAHPRCQEMKDCFDAWVRERLVMELDWIKKHETKTSAFVVGRSGYSPSRNDGVGIGTLGKKMGVHRRKYIRTIAKITKNRKPK